MYPSYYKQVQYILNDAITREGYTFACDANGIRVRREDNDGAWELEVRSGKNPGLYQVRYDTHGRIQCEYRFKGYEDYNEAWPSLTEAWPEYKPDYLD